MIFAHYLIKAISSGLFASSNNEKENAFSPSAFKRILLKFKRKQLNITDICGYMIMCM